jgi:hypothetical protein
MASVRDLPNERCSRRARALIAQNMNAFQFQLGTDVLYAR